MTKNKDRERGGSSSRQLPAKAMGANANVRRIILILLSLVLMMVFIAAGIGIWKLTHISDYANTGYDRFPDYVSDPSAPPGAPKAYQAAIDYYEDFSKIPCYCGCGQSAKHEGLQDCFISSIKDDDIKFSNHGAGWGLCVEEALYVLQEKSAGRPIEEIRGEIDNKYGGGNMGVPTPTPPI